MLLAHILELLTTLLTLAGAVYGVLALLGARSFVYAQRPSTGFTPPVSILKPVKGAEPHLYAAFASHCVQRYAGEVELLFGVSSLEDAAVAEIARLRVEFPRMTIRLVECPLRLGASGKVSNLVQMLPQARFEHVVVNDSDISVGPQYLTRVMAAFAASGPPTTNPTAQQPTPQPAQTGLVTVPYIGIAEGTLWSRREALGISTEFFAGVLTARFLEGGIRFGLGSTLATTKSALAQIGGFEALLDQLADDYEIGARLAAAGYRVELVDEVVSTTVPAYTLRSFADHQLRWARSTRDSRPWGYAGLGVTYLLPWAMATVIASGASLWSFTLLTLALLLRVAVALTTGVGILHDGQVLRDILLLPLRDGFGLFFWAWSYASDEVVWRGERFTLRRGRMGKSEQNNS
jgi:ceramide glucosyltransferase